MGLQYVLSIFGRTLSDRPLSSAWRMTGDTEVGCVCGIRTDKRHCVDEWSSPRLAGKLEVNTHAGSKIVCYADQSQKVPRSAFPFAKNSNGCGTRVVSAR